MGKLENLEHDFGFTTKEMDGIKAAMLELIGDDVPDNGTYPKEQVFAVNQSKAYQRKQVNEL